jgi:hypothetical protein
MGLSSPGVFRILVEDTFEDGLQADSTTPAMTVNIKRHALLRARLLN